MISSSSDGGGVGETAGTGCCCAETDVDGTTIAPAAAAPNKIPKTHACLLIAKKLLPGKLLFTDLTVDPSTGQVSVRAELPNPEGMLLPGTYVRVRLEQAQIDSAALIPQQAVTRNEKGNFVMVVADDGSIAPRPVQISQSQGTNWIVTSGLKAGEKVMVDGLIKVGMGAKKVTPVPWKGNAPAAAQPAAPAAAPAAQDKPSAAPSANADSTQAAK